MSVIPGTVVARKSSLHSSRPSTTLISPAIHTRPLSVQLLLLRRRRRRRLAAAVNGRITVPRNLRPTDGYSSRFSARATKKRRPKPLQTCYRCGCKFLLWNWKVKGRRLTSANDLKEKGLFAHARRSPNCTRRTVLQEPCCTKCEIAPVRCTNAVL